MSAIVETPSHAAGPGAAWTTLWASETDTQQFASRLAACPAIVNSSLSLQGDLGAGKTTFVRHLLRALGVQGRIKSPTYAVVEPHTAACGEHLMQRTPLSIWHFDFYRFNDPREWEDAGFRELFASPGLKLVEWPERADGFLPPMDLHLRIQILPMNVADPTDEANTPRQVTVAPLTASGERLLAALQA